MATAPIIERILHEYPYPIAKCYERLIGARDIAERWNNTRYLIEASLKYLACVAVAQYISSGQRDEKTNAALTCLDRPSLGHWLNILMRCEQYNQAAGYSYLPAGLLASKVDSEPFANASAVMSDPRAERPTGTLPRASPSRLLESYVAYRNRTAGHGSPSREHMSAIAPALESAIVDLLVRFDFLCNLRLVHITDIRLDRHTCIHGLTSLMGTSQVAISDYVADMSKALVGHDRKIYLCNPGSDTPSVSLHPLVIYARDDVYLLHHSDLRRNVEYICHHTGELYSADRIFEDFKDALGSYIGQSTSSLSGFEPESVYEESIRMSLIDGIVSEQERDFLSELRTKLSLSEDTATAIEAKVRAEPSPSSATRELHTSLPDPPPSSKATGAIRTVPVGQLDAPESPLSRTRMLFISYASIGNSFWAEFVSRLVSEAQRREWVFSIVTPDPSNDHDASAMSGVVAEVDRLLARHEPDLILLVPFPSVAFGSLFVRRIRNHRVPVLTIDSTLEVEPADLAAGMPRPPSVIIDNRRGGQLAAQLLLARRKGDAAAPRFLAMPGLDSAWHSIERIEGFRDAILRDLPDARVRVLPEGRFERSRAHSIIRDFLEDSDLSRYEGIFCCNDDMALGAYTAVCERLKSEPDPKGFSIVGFNNTAEFRSVLAADPFGCLAGSVDQSLETYTQTVFARAEALLAGTTVDDKTVIEPRIVSTS